MHTILTISLFAMLLLALKKISDLLDHCERQSRLIQFQAKKLVELKEGRK